MPGIHLRQPGFAYSACEPFMKRKERIQKFKETRDSRYIYQKACTIYLSKTRQSLFSTWHGLRRF